ncbi:MAG: hypothetical protein ACJA1A_002940 [Saprospiraceae bacterium]|jgi:hypothetical protein|tara:strand:+ start:244 stop:402 length:159 start_codon:yes stop_codon:yes gene_type:complete
MVDTLLYKMANFNYKKSTNTEQISPVTLPIIVIALETVLNYDQSQYLLAILI